MRITTLPAETCEIRLRGSNSSTPIILNGDVYVPGIPNLPLDKRRIRYAADFLEIMWTGDRGYVPRITVDGEEKKPLVSIEKFATLAAWTHVGPVDLQIWINGNRVVGANLDVNQWDKHTDWSRLSQICQLLLSIAGPSERDKIELTLDDLLRAGPSLLTFQALVKSTSLQIDFEPPANEVEKCNSIVYYAYADVRDFTFYVLLEREFKDSAKEGKLIRAMLGDAQIIDAYCMQNPDAKQSKMMQGDFERFMSRHPNSSTVLALGDVLPLLEGGETNSNLD